MTRVCEMVDLQFAPDTDDTSIHVFDMACCAMHGKSCYFT